MKKVVLFALPLIVVALVGAYLATGAILRSAVQKGATRALGVQATLASADFNAIAGEVTLAELAVENPKGYAEGHFLSIREARAATSASALMADQVAISLLEIDDVSLSLEQRGFRETNYGEILKSLGRLPQPKQADASKTFLVERLVIRDVKARLRVGVAGRELASTTVTLPEVALENLGSAPLTLPQLTGLVVRTILADLVKNGSAGLPAELAEMVRELLD